MGLVFAIHQRMASDPDAISVMAEEITVMESQRLGVIIETVGRRAGSASDSSSTPAERVTQIAERGDRWVELF